MSERSAGACSPTGTTDVLIRCKS